MSIQVDSVPMKLSKTAVEREKKLGDSSLGRSSEINIWQKITVVQTEDAAGAFSERQDLPLNAFEYPRNGSNPGLVLIFNQESFEDKPYRLGSRRDVNEIITCMSRLGFNINENHVFTDLTRDEILRTTQSISKEDLSQDNSLIVFFLTHGDSFNRLHAHDLSLEANELWQHFMECPHLKNKPKMFIFQACKGDSYSTISNKTDEKIELVPEKTFNSNYIGPDMLIVYSTAEGNVSFRDPKTGTWFIQELCKNFLAYGRRDDAVALIMRTSKCLCRNYYYHEKDVVKKQMPVFVSTLRKKFYLNRNKDRNVLIKLVKDQESMLKRIKTLEKKVDELVKEKEKKN